MHCYRCLPWPVTVTGTRILVTTVAPGHRKRHVPPGLGSLSQERGGVGEQHVPQQAGTWVCCSCLLRYSTYAMLRCAVVCCFASYASVIEWSPCRARCQACPMALNAWQRIGRISSRQRQNPCGKGQAGSKKQEGKD